MRNIMKWLLTVAAMMSLGRAQAGDNVPDFNFPQDVSRDATVALERALKAQDGQGMVDALVRYSIAMGNISNDNIDPIVERIEDVAKKEKRADYRALLYHFEARVFREYKEKVLANRYVPDDFDEENFPAPKLKSPYAQWSQEHMQAHIDNLVRQSVAEKEALMACPITAYPTIIKCNALGAKYIPNLYQFLLYRGRDLVGGKLDDELRDKGIKAAREGDITTSMFAIVDSITDEYGNGNSTREKLLMELYQANRTNEVSGLPLMYLSGDKFYASYQDYVRRFPKSIYADDVRNSIYYVERENVTVKAPKYQSARDSVKIELKLRNVNHYEVVIYREPDSVASNYYRGKTSFDPGVLPVHAVYSYDQEGTVPFEAEHKVTLPPLPYGRYIVMPRYKHAGKEVIEAKASKDDEMIVTDVLAYVVAAATDEKQAPVKLIAVDAHSGKPQSGVVFVDEDGKKTAPSGADGITVYTIDRTTGRNSTRVSVLRGDDRYGPSMSIYGHSQNDPLRYDAEIFTDLAIYRPGEKIHYAAVLFYVDATARRVLANETVKVRLSDANGKDVAEKELVSDIYGRVEGEFDIPTDRLNGTYRLTVVRTVRNSTLAYHNVEVSEYKTPTFTVTMPVHKGFNLNEPVVVTGKAETYTGLPVGNSEVMVSVSRRSWDWRWWRCYPIFMREKSIFNAVVKTEADGTFSVELPDSIIPEKSEGASSCSYNYVAHAQVTNVAGESQEAVCGFNVGHRNELSINGYDHDHLNTTPWRIPLEYHNTNETLAVVECTYELSQGWGDDRKVLAKGSFMSDKPVVDLTSVPDGVYRLKVESAAVSDWTSTNLTLYRMTSKALPDGSEKPLWVPRKGHRVDDRNVAHINVGVGAPTGHIYYVAYGRTKVLGEGWLHYAPGMHEFTFKIPDVPEEYLRVHFMSTYGSQHYEESIMLRSPINDGKLSIKATSFRDRLTPGDREHWSFTLLGNGNKPQRGAMLFEMIDKAVNDIRDNHWSFAPSLYSLTPADFRHLFWGFGNNDATASWRAPSLDAKRSNYQLPDLYTYGESIFKYESYRIYNSMGARAGGRVLMKEARMVEDYAASPEAEMVTDNMAMSRQAVDEEKEVAVDEARLADVKLRLADVKTALWLPMLTSDESGEVHVEFDAPEFNTTWLVQALAYDQNLTVASMVSEVLTRKPIMVKSSLPRFVRQGDRATLAATLQNATDEATTADAMIELFDPRTGNIYATRKFNEQLAAQGMNALTIDWVVPDTIPYVGFRVRAANNVFSDGEQVMLPVLPATQPIIESAPFFLNAGSGTTTLQLPRIPDGARVTLEYSDNPVWYCVTALPSIMSEQTHLSTGIAHNLFAQEVASGIAARQPIIKEAFAFWRESSLKDSTLVSQLSRNRDLKVGSLKASPWMRDDERQTLRMERLAELMDDSVAVANSTKLIAALADLQMPDGGFAWYKYPGCKSSTWATGEVLELLGEVKHLGYHKPNATFDAIVKKALDYYDAETIADSKKKENKKSLYAGYAYVRSLHSDVPMSKDASKLVKKTLKRMGKEWGKLHLSQGEKAFWAMTLFRGGNTKEASRIVESIRQFAITKPELGMYWDNYSSGGWFTPHQVAVTATVLQAMGEVDPRKDELDQVRKWMLLSKQTGDWGDGSMAADAVQALLNTGTDWLQRGAKPEILLNGQPVEFSDFDAYVGYCRKTIEASESSAITVTAPQNHPAWGAIYSQWSQPMTTVAEASVDAIAISKEVNVYRGDGKVSHRDELRVGDKVQVRLVITTNREIDYLTVTDERAACFEPVDRISGYAVQDGTYYYRETKDAQTNLFFDRLRKGTHVFSYDVYVTAPGTFSLGVATAQSQQAAEITAHSAGATLIVAPAEK